MLRQLCFSGYTWNLHGKGVQHVSSLLHHVERPADLFFLRELGDAKHVPLGSSRTDTDTIAGREYQTIIANPLLSHRCSAILVALDCEFVCKHVHVHEFGVVVNGTMHDSNWVFASLHFPHQQRADAPEVWERGVSSLLGLLSGLPWQTNILIGHDLNQNLHASVDEFIGMMHYREFVFQTSLTPSPPLGNLDRSWKCVSHRFLFASGQRGRNHIP